MRAREVSLRPEAPAGDALVHREVGVSGLDDGLDLRSQCVVYLAVVVRLLIGAQDRHGARWQHYCFDASRPGFQHHALAEAVVGQGLFDIFGEDVEAVG